ncbi:MAG: TetR/AcrR family transcriptional regulator [Candidatus Thiodiazotropha sp. DIVDIV]
MGRRGEHSKSEIENMALVAAEELIETQGYEGLSARKVASAIGYTVGSLYFVFKNLDELVQRVNGRTLDQLYMKLSESLTECRHPQDCLYTLGLTYLDYASNHAHRWRMVFEHQPQTEGLLMEIHEDKVDRVYELVERQIAALTMNSMPQGEIALAARAIWSGIHGIAILRTTYQLQSEVQDSVAPLVKHLIERYLAGLNAMQTMDAVIQHKEVV